jgi:hypothetical protein
MCLRTQAFWLCLLFACGRAEGRHGLYELTREIAPPPSFPEHIYTHWQSFPVENAADKAPTVKLLELTAPTSYIQQPKTNPHHYLDFPSSSNTQQRKSILSIFFIYSCSKEPRHYLDFPSSSNSQKAPAYRQTHLSVCASLIPFPPPPPPLSLFLFALLLSLSLSLALSLTHTHKHTCSLAQYTHVQIHTCSGRAQDTLPRRRHWFRV